MLATKAIAVLLLLSAVATAQGGPYAGPYATTGPQLCKVQRDWKKAVWRVPLHFALSLPFAAGSLVIPPIGTAYIHWRRRAEKADQQSQRDTAMKAAVDFYSQTALVRGTLRIYGIRP
jgi:hypothetical protein